MLYHDHKSLFWNALRAGLTICLVLTIMLGTLPRGVAQADADAAAAPVQLSAAGAQVASTLASYPEPGRMNPAVLAEEYPARTYPPLITGNDPTQTTSRPEVERDSQRTFTSYPQPEVGGPDVFKSEINTTVDGDVILPAGSSAGGSLPGGIEARGLPAGMITVDLTYDVVMGFVNPYEVVTVDYGSNGYGAAVADEGGFFWTLIWHVIYGYQLGIECDTDIVIYTDQGVTSYYLPCVTGSIDVLNDQVMGIVAGDTTGSLTVTATHNMSTSWTSPQPPAPGAVSKTSLTSHDGSFNILFTEVDMGAESMVTVDVDFSGINIRTYLYSQNVFLVEQFNKIGGFASPGQTVNATVYEGNSTTVRWNDVSTGNWPHGDYAFWDVPIEAGDKVEVILDGSPATTIDTIAVSLGSFNFDTTANTLSGVAPDGDVRASLWQWVGEDRLYQEAHATATGGMFTINFSSLRPRDEVLVVVTDPQGDQVQITSGPPFVNAWISLDTNLDCVFGRLDGPGLPIVATLDKGGGEVYVRDPGLTTDAGNGLNNLCFTIRDEGDNYVDFEPSDIVTLKDGTPGWEGSVTVVDFAWSGNTATETISGNTADGDLEIALHQWQDDWYPLHGRATQQVTVSSGAFSAGFSDFDVRDGVAIELAHYDPTSGFATQTNNFSYWPTLPFMWVFMPYAVGGLVSTPYEGVTASLYDIDGTTLLAQTSEDHGDHPYWYWLDDFQGIPLQPGYKVVVNMDNGWSGEMIIPDLTIAGDVGSEVLTASGPQDLLLLEVYDNEYSISQFVPGPNAGLDASYFGWDLQQKDMIAVTYQYPDGNHARIEAHVGEIYNVGTWLSPGSQDWIWGNAVAGSTVSITAPTETIEVYAEPECDGCWSASTPLQQGDSIIVSAGDGFYPVDFSIANPFTAVADSTTDEISGQIEGWLNGEIEIFSNWDETDTPGWTNETGHYLVEFADIPPGGSGNVHYTYIEDGVQIVSNLWYRAPDLLLDVFPSWNSIEGVYALGHDITLEVYDDLDSLKAFITIPVEELWGSITGFNTAEHPDDWSPSQPEIVVGDKIYGYVDGNTTPDAYVRVGAITGDVDVDTDSISGAIEAPWYYPTPGAIWVECHPWGAPEGGPSKWVEVTLDSSGVGSYFCQWDPGWEWDVEHNQDIAVSIYDPDGHRVFEVFNEPSYELYMSINYGHDWIEGWYPPGYEVTLTVMNHDLTETKATTTIMTGEIPWWGGGTGFATSQEGTVWDPGQPNIEQGDWVFGDVTVGEDIYHAEVQLGAIDGDLDVDLDRFTGTVDASSWLSPLTPVTVQCHPWGAPEGVNGIETTVLPDGVDTFTCDWSEEWDVPPNNDIGVSYLDPGGHWIFNTFRGYSEELMLRVHYDHNWIEGNYEPEHEIHLTVYDSVMVEKAFITMPTGPIDDWGGQSGFATYLESAVGVPDDFDIEPGDYIHGEVDDGLEFTADVKVGFITGTPDLDVNSITGTVDADWLVHDPGLVGVACSIWEQNSREVYDSVIPNGTDTYECVFEGDNYYDILPETNLMVSYFDPAGHQIFGDFSPPAPYLKIEKWFIGESPAVSGNAAFYIQYQNQGNAPAENVTITDTLVGMTYLRDSSGFSTTVQPGATEVIWDVGTVDPSDDWHNLIIFAEVTADAGQLVSNTVEISTSSPDQGEPWEKVGYDERFVAENDTQLSVGKWTWTWNPAPGEDFVYGVNVCNNGSTGSSAVTLLDTLPDAVTFMEWWAGDPGWTWVGQSGQIIELEHTCISSWSCSDVYFRVHLSDTAEPGDELINHAAISGGNDLSLDDNETELQHNVGEPTTDLSIWQNWHWGSLTPGGYYRYGISFGNDGNEAVSGPIDVIATLPDGTSFAGWDSWGWVEVDPVVYYDPVTNEVTWQVGDLMAGVQGTIEVWVDIDPGTEPGTILTHLAEIEVQPSEEYTDNNVSTMTEMVNEYGPNLRIRKEGGIHGHGEGHNAWYRLTVENIGDQTVNDVVVTDTYPVGMVLDGDINVNFWDPWERVLYTDHFDVTLSKLEPGWNMQIDYNTYLADLIPGQIFENTAQVLPLMGDVNPDDNTVSFAMATGPDMFIEKTLVEGDFQPGTYVTYLLTFGNAQTAWWWGMEGNAIITDILPEGMTFVSAYQRWCDEENEWECVATPTFEDDGQTLIWDLYPIGAGNWNQIRLLVEIDEAVGSNNPLINAVTITSEHANDIDPYDHNNQSSYDPGLITTKNIFLPLILR